jgi:hypothetical protein
MDTVKEGLSLYAYLNTYGMIFMGVLILISAIGILFKIITGNYQKSPSSTVDYYTIANLTKCSQYEITNNLCKLQLEYSDGTNIYKYDIDSKTKVGDTTVFYEQKNPKSYMITPSPYIIPGVFSCIACLTLFYAIGRLIIMRSSSNAAAIIGGIDVASNIMRKIRH